MSDTTDIEADERRAASPSSPLAEILGVGIAIVVVGGLLSFDEGGANVGRRRSIVSPPPAATIDAAGYEALRDGIAFDASLVPMVRSALGDGRIDVVELDRIAPRAVRTHTALNVDEARADMMITLEAKEGKR